jgi:hypothetical protein
MPPTKAIEDPGDESAARAFVKRHHVHYFVDPEWAIQGGARWPVGFNVHLFAGHGRRAAALPGGPRSRALAESLRLLAESILPECRRLARVELEPFRPVLYASSEVPGTDEVALTIRVLREFEQHAYTTAVSEEPCLKELRRRLKRLALPER